MATDADKAASLYNLGVIAFNVKQLQVAFDTWQDLIEQYPESDEGKIVSERISYLMSEIVELSSDVVEDEIARSYLQHGDFWSDDIKRRHWLIDSSWLDKVELACEWYDKVIAEFPGTPAAKLAYLEKFRTIIGKDGAQSYETRKSFSEYIEPLLATYEDFVKAFPDSDLIPLLKFQLAQAYWREEDRVAKNLLLRFMASDSTAVIIPYFYVETEKWLKSVIDGNTNNFYTQVATARLEAIEISKLEAVKQAEETRMNTRRDKILQSNDCSIYEESENTISGRCFRGQFVLSDSTVTLLWTKYSGLFGVGQRTLVRPIRQFDNFNGSMEDFIEMMLKDAKSDDK